MYKHFPIHNVTFVISIVLCICLMVTFCNYNIVNAIDYNSYEYWPADGVSYYIRNVKSGKYLDLFGTPTNGANVGLWSGHKGTNQQWTLRLSTAYTASSNVYEIYNVANPDYYLSVNGNSSENWTELVVQHNTNTPAPIESRFWITPPFDTIQRRNMETKRMVSSENGLIFMG